jgi:dTDP-4-amino-4,6-dideoxygalactose transaminase
MQELGYNYRMTDFQAALGISQLKRADAGLKKRQEIAQRYNQAFARVENLSIPYVADDIYHAYHLYVIQVKDRLGLYNYLRKNHIHAQVHYIPLHLMPYYQGLGNKKGDLPVAEAYYEHCLSLPMYPALTNEEQNFILKIIRTYINNGNLFYCRKKD